jgi:hypothetical protein
LRTRAVSIGKDSVVVAPIYLPASTPQAMSLPANTVVFVSLNHANRALYDTLAARGLNARVVGDANSARHLAAAIREGHLAGASV